MKKYIAFTTAIICMLVSQAKADDFTVNFGLGNLRDQNSALVVDGSLAIAVADTAGLGLAGLTNQLTGTMSLTPGSAIGSGNGYYLMNLTANGTSGGYESGAVNNQTLTSPLATGQNVYIIWFPTLTTSSTTIGNGTWYGVIGGAQASPYSIGEGGQAWTIPSGGSTVNMYADDASNFGSVPSSLLTAQWHTAAIPEPSTLLLVGAGLMGLITLRRRRS
jgi:hypothetical protein